MRGSFWTVYSAQKLVHLTELGWLKALSRLRCGLGSRWITGVLVGLAALAMALGVAAGSGLAQDAASTSAPVTLSGQTLFYIDVGAGGYTSAMRSQAVSSRIGRFARGATPLEALEVRDNALTETSDIMAGRVVLVSFSDADARALNVRRQVLAQRTRRIIATAVEAFRAERHPRQIALDGLYTLLALLALVLGIGLINRVMGASAQWLHSWEGSRIGSLRLFGSEILPPDRVVDVLCEELRLARLGLLVLLLGGFVSLVSPEPFVLQTGLNDFYVSYELNAYTDKPKLMARIYSELHQNIQDHCFAAGIEILSPHYRAVRDGNTLAVPAEYYPPGYQVPGFRLASSAPSESTPGASHGASSGDRSGDSTPENNIPGETSSDNNGSSTLPPASPTFTDPPTRPNL